MKYLTVLLLFALTSCINAEKIEIQVGPTPKGSLFNWVIEKDSDGVIQNATRYNSVTQQILDKLVVTKNSGVYHAESGAGNLKVSHDISVTNERVEDRMTSVNSYLKTVSASIRTLEYKDGLVILSVDGKTIETLDLPHHKIVDAKNKMLLERTDDVIHVYSDAYVIDVAESISGYSLTYKNVPQVVPATPMTVRGKLNSNNQQIILINLCLLPHDLLFLLFL